MKFSEVIWVNKGLPYVRVYPQELVASVMPLVRSGDADALRRLLPQVRPPEPPSQWHGHSHMGSWVVESPIEIAPAPPTRRVAC